VRELKHKQTISVPAYVVFNWFKNLDEHYIEWHPIAHRKFEWLSEKPVGTGSRFSFEENINGHEHKLLMEVIEYDENRKIAFSSIKIEGKSKLLPAWVMRFLSSIFKVRIEMKRIFEESTNSSTTIYTTHKLGAHIPIISKLVELMIDIVIFPSNDHLKHINEEGMYMKKCLEKIET